MSKTTKIIIALVAVAVIAGGAVLLTSGKDYNSKDNNPSTGSNNSYNHDNSINGSKDKTPAAVTVIYTDKGFDPAKVTLKSGETLRIFNSSKSAVSPSSDPHPTHTLNPELNFPEIGAGKSATMTLTKKGTWGYHNHLNTDQRGTVVVE